MFQSNYFGTYVFCFNHRSNSKVRPDLAAAKERRPSWDMLRKSCQCVSFDFCDSAQNFVCTWCNQPPPTPITRVQFLIPSLVGLRLFWFNSILMQIWDTIIYNEWLGSVERRRFYIFPSLSILRLLSYSIKMYVIHDQNFVLWWIPYYFNGLDFYTNQVSCRIVDTIIFVLFSISIFDYFKFKASENKQYCYILKWKIICVLW